MRFRQVHLDFHTNETIPGIGSRFDAKAFAKAFKDAYVDSVTVFSKCHHGVSYHPTKVGKQHPHLKFDLLRAQIDALHGVGINAPVYLTATWDELAAFEHPEWRTISPDGSFPNFRSEWGNGAGWAFLDFSTPYLDYLCAQTEEVMVRYPDADGIFIRDFDIRMRAQPQVSLDLPTGIALYSGRNLRVENGHLSGFRMVDEPGKYPNGDGLSSERPVDGLNISNVTSDDNSDGGFDLKGSNITLTDLSATRNYRSYRFWGGVHAGTLTSIDPRKAHVWAGTGANVVIDKLIARSSTTAVILYVDGAQSVTIGSCELSVPAGTKLTYLATNTTVITLGPGCAL